MIRSILKAGFITTVLCYSTILSAIQIKSQSEINQYEYQAPIGSNGEVDDRIVASDEMRLKYRYLDLRRPIMQENLQVRHNVIMAARNYFNDNKFIGTHCSSKSRAYLEMFSALKRGTNDDRFFQQEEIVHLHFPS